jgi:hypothetical protein
MEFQHIDVNFNLHKTYKKISINSLLIGGLLAMNDEADTRVRIFAQRNVEDDSTRGKGTTIDGLKHNPVGDYVIDM